MSPSALIAKLLKWLGLTALFASALVSILVLWITKSETGLRWALQQVPDVLMIEEISGQLSDLSFSGLSLRLDGTQVSVAKGQLKWRLSDLLKGTLRVENLLLNTLEVQIITLEADASEPFEVWSGVDLPIDIEIENVRISTLTLNSNGDQITKFDEILAAIKVNDNLLHLSQLDVHQKSNRVTLTGKVDLSASKDGIVNIANTVEWAVDQKDASDSGLLQLDGSVVGTWRSLEIQQRTTSPLKSSVSLTVENVLTDKILWQGQLTSQGKHFKPSSQPSISLDQGDFRLSGQFSPSMGTSGLIAHLSGAISGGSPALSNWELDTDIGFENDTITVSRFNLLQKPDLDQTDANADSGELTIAGSIAGVSAFLTGQNSSEAIADLNGNWRNLSWPIDQATKQITISGNFSARGVPENFSVDAQAKGQSYQKPLTARASIHVADRTVDLKSVKLRSGTSQVDISGTLADKISLNWNISSPKLSELVPQLSGDLNSNGTLNGKPNALRISASARSSNIGFDEFQIYNVNLSGNGLLAASSEAMLFNVDIDRIEHKTSELVSNLAVTLSGSGKEHTFSGGGHLIGQSAISVNAQGSLSENGWHGQINDLSLKQLLSSLAPPDGANSSMWQLQQPVKLALKNNTITTDTLCLNKQAQSICAEIRANDKNLVANGSIHEVELSNFDPLLSLYDSRLTGKLNGEFSYDKSNSDSASNLLAQLQANNSTLTIQRAGSRTESLTIESAKLRISQNSNLKADSTIVLANSDQVSAEISIASAFESANFLDEELDGHIVATVNDLSTLQILSGPASELRGELKADISLSGSISDPKIGMQTYLKNGQMALPELGISLSDMQMNAMSTDKQKITLDGSLLSGKGKLEISGNLDLSELSKPRIAIAANGNNVELMRTPEIHVDGDLNTQILITSDLIDVSGDLRLIHADVDFQLPENAVLASEDVVLLGEEEAVQASQQKIRLQIDLGDQTHIRAQGLDTYLVGELELQQDPGGVMRANGQIDVKDGRYNAYNQKLEIDKGQLIFNGGPVDDPSLVLRAQKSVNTLTAGVSVTGRASSPILELYSTPSMPDQDILSVLIFDKRIGDLASQDGLTLLRIANSLRGDGTNKSQVDVLTQNIQESLGLSNLELQLNGSAPSLVAGKQLSSKFYVGYGYGLLDAAQSLILRYKINPFWSIQGDLGVDSGADLRYQIER